MSDPIYLDYNATTPVAPEVLEEMIPALRETWGNPSSTHPIGLRAKQAVETARARVATMLGCHTDEIIFTSGGTESDNAAIIGVAEALADRGKHMVTSAIEHPAVEEACRYLESRGWTVTRIGVDGDGRVDVDEVEAALRPDTTLVSIMHANNETGVIQPVAGIARAARARMIPVHTDAAQSIGKIPVKIDDLQVDLLTVAGHKLYAPKGVGALYIRRSTPFAGFMRGAGHESGRRAGTENVAQVIGLGAACQLAEQELGQRREHLAAVRDRLEDRLRQRFADLVVHGEGVERLPNTASIALPGADANTLLAELDGVAASAGAACHAGGTEPSHVLTAMGVPAELSLCTLRLTVGRTTTEEQVDNAVGLIADAADRLRGDRDEAAGMIAGEEEEIRLTRYTHGLGCACKLRPRLLEEMLRDVDLPVDPRVLVGSGTADDAGVYQMEDDRLLVATVDFFTPVVDDPYDFGRIAAVNALSDIYAMGSSPIFALNLVGFPESRLPMTVLRTILQGAAAVCRRAGVSIIGGHTIEDTEPKFGMCVIGTTDRDSLWTNAGARPGDDLVLTKPLGTGLLTTLLKRDGLEADLAVPLIESMTALNAAAAEAAASTGGITACTDVTGFGLLGHLFEMTSGSGVDARLDISAVPLLPGARSAVSLGAVPGGTHGNLEHLETRGGIVWDDGTAEVDKLLMCDAQTSGGLLLAVEPERTDMLLQALAEAGTTCAVRIGHMTEPGEGRIYAG